jgi:uncharacterized protein
MSTAQSLQSPPSIWRKSASPSAQLALVIALVLVFAAMRGLGMLGSASLRFLLPLSFVLMAATPWLLLSAHGRRQIGLSWPLGKGAFTRAAALGVTLGMVWAALCFALGWALFGATADNWFVSVANNYRSIMDTRTFSQAKLHLIFTLPALIFSPIGEEIFFRGVLQRALEERLSRTRSTLIECLLFGVVHLCHHGLVRTAAGLSLLPLSGALWALLMAAAAGLFAWLRHKSGSLYPAMLSHAAFNLAMNLLIFSALWQLAS